MLRRLNANQRRSLRQWSMELAIVVVGVLIALWTQQWADGRASRRQAADAEVRIREELGTNLDLGLERMAIHGCLKHRLRTIADGLAAGRTDWSSIVMADGDEGRMALARVYRMPSRLWITDEYRGSLGNGELSSLVPERRAELAEAYVHVVQSGEQNARENELATQLAPLQFNTPLSASERNALLRTVAELDRLNGLMTLVARQQIEATNKLGFQMTDEEIAKIKAENGMEAWIARLRKMYGNCVDARVFGDYEPRLLS